MVTCILCKGAVRIREHDIHLKAYINSPCKCVTFMADQSVHRVLEYHYHLPIQSYPLGTDVCAIHKTYHVITTCILVMRIKNNSCIQTSLTHDKSEARVKIEHDPFIQIHLLSYNGSTFPLGLQMHCL